MSFTDSIFRYFHLYTRSDQCVYVMFGENGKVDHVCMGGEDEGNEGLRKKRSGSERGKIENIFKLRKGDRGVGEWMGSGDGE